MLALMLQHQPHRRSRTSGEYLLDVLDMTPSSQGVEPATFPERFKASLQWLTYLLLGKLEPVAYVLRSR